MEVLQAFCKDSHANTGIISPGGLAARMKPGEVLRTCRIKSGHSLTSLSDATGIPEGTLNAWELNPDRLKQRRQDHRDAVRKILKEFGASGVTISENEFWGIEKRAESVAGDVDMLLMADLATYLSRVGFDSSLPDAISEDARELLSRVAKIK